MRSREMRIRIASTVVAKIGCERFEKIKHMAWPDVRYANEFRQLPGAFQLSPVSFCHQRRIELKAVCLFRVDISCTKT